MSKDEKNDEKRMFYNYRHRPPQVKFCSTNPSKVQESPLDARSPQELLQKYGMYTDKPALDTVQPFYADLTAFKGFEDTCNQVRDIKEKFNALDVDIKAKFNHNPEEFCRYITSKDFDVREIMTAEQYKEYERIINEEKSKAEYEKYIKSDAYKKDLQEQAQRQAYEQARYDEWKKNFGGSK